ncbi:hypothetical protein [Methylophaga thiooxydans]|uniref:Uncharacterized protein n=1 Tax=Methylophaga thiooxydans DMS010 TaxID=637616 RepID=C0N6A8_9GAMM|nr:hypothetical protein [Methylophaga thiooxydans]EEF79395.1 hypothetical protein MDMS009_1982 [Methylophaga thiooxydans DMS010]
MKKLLLLLPFIFAGQQALALSAEDETNYKQHYAEQVKPLVVKKLSAERPEMTAQAVKAEADFFVLKMAGCQLEGLSNLPDTYRDKAILPVANGEDVEATTRALNTQIKQDVDSGKLNKDKAMTMLQGAQQAVQVCLNSRS